jgi:hypothetical protein
MKIRLSAIIATGALVFASACSKQESVREIDWAKSALARNPAYEIVATDESTGVFTVKDTTTGMVHTLRLEDLIAGPLPPKVKPEPAAVAPAPSTETVEAEPVEEASTLASNQTTETVEVNRAAPGQALAEGPGYSISKADATHADTQARAELPASLEGPGYSISREAAAGEAGASRDNPAPAEQLGSNVERRTDPIVCQGDRLMRIDGETIEFTGDAVIAEKGCDLYITNARIRATGGVGLIVRQARVHIVNSSIGGTHGSYEASQGGEIYVARSTFTGIGRRFDSATMNDLGDNTYQLN